MSFPIPETMHAWRKHKGNPEPVWEGVPVPKPHASGFLIKLLASGVCHSDYSLLTNENQRPWFQDKYILGHEGCGTIVRIGSNVQNSGFKVGDRVASIAVPGCGADTCPECSRDLPQLCEIAHHSGIGQDGFYAPYAVLDIRAMVKVPESVPSPVAAVATDAVKTSYHAITRRGEVKSTDIVLLFGLGGLGLNGLQIVKHIGARVIVTDVRQECLDEAVALGIPTSDIVPVGGSVQDFVEKSGLHGKIDTTLDFVGKHQTFSDAQNVLRRGGKMVCIGTLDSENTIDMKIGIRKRLTILFTYGGKMQDLKEVLELIEKGAVTPRVETADLEEFATILKALHRGEVKARIALVHK